MQYWFKLECHNIFLHKYGELRGTCLLKNVQKKKKKKNLFLCFVMIPMYVKCICHIKMSNSMFGHFQNMAKGV